MKILLIKPALSPVLFAPMWGDPLELEYLAAAVPDHVVEILDMRVDDDLQTRLEKFRPNLVCTIP